jgi:RNA polymerase sigma-70 factor, ECF subfamily
MARPSGCSSVERSRTRRPRFARSCRRPGRPSSGDDERLTRLYEDTSPDLLTFLLRRCATAEDAADCLAESYRIAWETRTRIPPGHQARPWLFGVARNIARQTRRSETRRAATTADLATAAGRWYAPSGPEDSTLAAALSELSPIDQEIITMIAADGLPRVRSQRSSGYRPTRSGSGRIGHERSCVPCWGLPLPRRMLTLNPSPRLGAVSPKLMGARRGKHRWSCHAKRLTTGGIQAHLSQIYDTEVGHHPVSRCQGSSRG